MKVNPYLLTFSLACLMSACTEYSSPVSDRPYRAQEQRAGSGWLTQPAATTTDSPGFGLPEPPAVQGALVNAGTGSSAPIPEPQVNISPSGVTTAPAISTPTVVPAPVVAPATKPARIKNEGPIPVATRYGNDPTRVVNPLDPSKRIRIIDKNGNIHPSGKVLKVPGTDFEFIVP